MAKADGKRRDGGTKPRDGAAKRREETARHDEHWKEAPDDHDYPAAADYPSLVLPNSQIAGVVDSLRRAPIVHRKAKDLLRASRLVVLDKRNPHVAVNLEKVRRGEQLSPVLVVRGSLTDDVAMTIVDGCHRTCASYHLDENADIPCRLVEPPAPAPRRAPRTPPAPPGGGDG